MRRRRVVITGLGVVAPNGIGKEKFGAALVSGQSGIGKISSLGDPQAPCHVAGRVTDFDLSRYLKSRSRNARKSMSRVSQFALASAQMAFDDARIDLARLNPRRSGLCYGTTTGKPDFDDDAARFFSSGVAGLEPTAWTEFSPHAVASHIAHEFGFSGPVATCSAGCCTGLMVVEWGANQIAEGRLDMTLVGSGDSLLSPLLVAAFAAGNLLSRQTDPTKASRPYDLHRDGLVPGEAAGAIVLESLESAVQRNARIYAEYLGYACAADGPSAGERNRNGQGLALAIAGALKNSGLEPDQIDCINSQGLSHPVLDVLETQGFKAALGKAAYGVPITSIKSTTGASFSGDGILQTISSCLILQTGVIPPIVTLETPDPECNLNYVVKTPRIARVKCLLTNTRALGGTNGVLILGRAASGR
jgi:3-oxoacyl-[acyl-carrier-protein] synthase II